MSASVAIVAALVAVVLAGGLWYAWHAWLQLCPHCGWIVRQVRRGWLRCPRCHKQYARPRLKVH